MISSQFPRSSERGAAAIEFALSAIVLFVLIFGCIAVAMGFYSYEVANQYARDASRYAIVHGNGCKTSGGASCNIGTGAAAGTVLATYLNNQIYPGINGNHLSVAANYALGPGETTCSVPACNGPGDQVAVTVSYQYLYAVPFIPSNALTMKATSTMVISQ